MHLFVPNRFGLFDGFRKFISGFSVPSEVSSAAHVELTGRSRSYIDSSIHLKLALALLSMIDIFEHRLRDGPSRIERSSKRGESVAGEFSLDPPLKCFKMRVHG